MSTRRMSEKLHWTRMGWNDRTMLQLLNRFIEEECLYDEMDTFLQRIANEEQDACEEDDE